MQKSSKVMKSRKSHKLNTNGVPAKVADRIANEIVDGLLANPCKAERGWDVSAGRKWVLVAFWGAETTVTFHRDEDEANEAYEDATINGADAFYAKTCRMMLQSDPIGTERT